MQSFKKISYLNLNACMSCKTPSSCLPWCTLYSLPAVIIHPDSRVGEVITVPLVMYLHMLVCLHV